MSKTMDNDHRQTFAEWQTAADLTEIQRLKAQVEADVKAANFYRDSCNTLRARIEELEAAIPCWADQLRRVVEQCNNVSTERDALREDLRRETACREGAESNSKWAAEEVLKLRAELEQTKQGENMKETVLSGSAVALLIDKLKDENARLKGHHGLDRILDLEAENKRRKAEQAELRSKLEGKLQASWKESDELRAELEEAQANNWQATAEKYRAELDAEIKENEDWQTMNAKSYERERLLEGRFKDLLDEKNRIMHAHDDLVVDNSVLQAELEQIKGLSMSYFDSRELNRMIHDLQTENARLKVELDGAHQRVCDLTEQLIKQDAELAALRERYIAADELILELQSGKDVPAATKPVPDVKVVTMYYYMNGINPVEPTTINREHDENSLKLTFTDGKLTGAEVVG